MAYAVRAYIPPPLSAINVRNMGTLQLIAKGSRHVGGVEGNMSLGNVKLEQNWNVLIVMGHIVWYLVDVKSEREQRNTAYNMFMKNQPDVTVGAIIIWSLADFVGFPTYKEWNYV